MRSGTGFRRFSKLKIKITMSTQTISLAGNVDRSCFKKDVLERIQLKNRKRAFKATPEAKEKIVTVIKITN